MVYMHPVLFTIGGIEFYSYGLMIGIGYVLGVLVAVKRAEAKGIDPDSLLGFFVLILVSGVTGGRLFHIALNTWNYPDLKSVFRLQDGGLSIHGVLFGGLLAAFAYSHFRKVNPARLLDVISPSVALGQAIGRIGCLLAGCCYGIPTNGNWGVLTRYAPGLRHPYQIYESIADFFLFMGLMRVSGRIKLDGGLVLLYISGYSMIRFFLEFFRAGETCFLGLSSGQWLSAALIGVCLIVYAYAKRKSGTKNPLPL
ncbi:MAG TPA: prolipoprotein diacylglyceryl transferase [Firmicutes bacterium]|nr:prolipoprotein diacylglyceryl transferase [Bacillota bacterium]